jgi:hypothetical protein
MGLRILLTNYTLSTRSGSELFVWDLATGLQTRGHEPVVYAPTLGRLAHELRAATIPVVGDQWIETYREVIDEHRAAPDGDQEIELRLASGYLSTIRPNAPSAPAYGFLREMYFTCERSRWTAGRIAARLRSS